MSPSPHLKTVTYSVSETLYFLVIYKSGRWTQSRNPVILSVIQHLQILLQFQQKDCSEMFSARLVLRYYQQDELPGGVSEQ
jgi:hypothetical protein